MKKMIVAATLASILFTASIAGARQAQVKTNKEMLKTEQKAERKALPAVKTKVLTQPKTDDKVIKKANDSKPISMPKKTAEVKK